MRRDKLTKQDAKTILCGLKQGVFPVSELNHLVSPIQDFTATTNVFGGVEIEITANDKRQLLICVMRGEINFDNMPDLMARLKENFFLGVMKMTTE